MFIFLSPFVCREQASAAFSRKLPKRKEWSVETIHWLLDVHFEKDFCRVEDKNIQQNLTAILE